MTSVAPAGSLATRQRSCDIAGHQAMPDSTPDFTALARLYQAPVQPSLGPKDFSALDRFAIQYNGVAIEVTARRGSKGAFLGAELSVQLRTVVTNAQILLRAERAFDRLGSRLRINREFQVGDPAFDRKVYIESNAPDVTLARLLDATVRELTLQVVAREGLEVLFWPSVVARAGRLVSTNETRIEIFAPKRLFADSQLMLAIPALLEALSRAVYAAHERGLAAHQGPTPYGRGAAPVDPSSELPLKTRTWRGVLASVVVLANWLGAALWDAPPTVLSTILGPTIVAGILILAVHFFGFSLLLRGRSESLRNVMLAIVFLFFTPFVSGAALAKDLNARFASGAPTLESGVARVRTGSKGAQWVELIVREHSFRLPRGARERLQLSGQHAVYAEVGEGALGGVFLCSVNDWRFHPRVE